MFRFFIFLALTFRISAQETMIRQVVDPVTDTHVEVLALFTRPSPGGFFPVRVKIANNLKTDSRVTLDFECASEYRTEVSARSSFSFDTPGGKTVTRDIIVPIAPPGDIYGGTNLTVKLNGSMGQAENSIRSSIDKSQPAVLLSEALFTPNASVLDSAITAKFSSSRGGSSEFAAKFDPKQLPDNWLGFSGYDSIIITDSDWTKIPPGARNAILSWVRLGGQLAVYTTSPTTLTALGLPDQAGYGTILIQNVASDLKLDATAVVDLVLNNPTKPRQQSNQNDFTSTWPLQNLFGGQTFRYVWFIIVLIIFAILVGPINLFVFAKSGQRHKLFITTPIISLGASLILIVLIITQDGFGGNGIRRTLMEVRPDGGLNAAYLHQEQFCRTGVLTGSDFTINPPVLFQPVAIASSRWARFTTGGEAKGNFNLQPSDGKLQASGDWFQSRSEHGHVLSAAISTRGRIEKTDTPGSYISTFEFPIDTFFYQDESQQWHRADGITPGKRFTPAPIDATMALPALTGEMEAFAERNRQFLKTAITRPGHFIAITSQAPGIDTNPGIHWKETRTVITGPVVAP
jgi:hypothetical protein